MEELFERTSVPKAYFTLALPVVAGMVASMVYNLADTFFIAQTQDARLVSGVAICTPLFSFLLAIGDIFGLGGSSVISRLLGAKDVDQTRRVSSWCLYAALVVGIVTAALLLLFEAPILHLLGTTNATYTAAAHFYRIMSIGAPIIIISLVPSNIIRTEGMAKASMVGTVLGTLLTIVLDPIFILVLHMGTAGAALATVIGYVLTDALLIWLTLQRAQAVSVDPRLARITPHMIWGVIAIGVPAAITNLTQAFGTAVLNRYVVEYGVNAMAALGITLKVYMVIMLVMVGFAFGAQPLLGYNYGAKNYARLKAIIRFDLFVEVVYALILAAVLMVFAPHIVAIFMHSSAVIHLGTTMVRVLLISTPAVGVCLVMTTLFQTIGAAPAALVMAIARQGVIFLPVIVALHVAFGYIGVLWAQPVADVLTMLIGLWLFRRHFKKIFVAAG
ncbi:MATE family efflux transporter [Lacticaseibacillus sharpeae]|uniref:Multidrug export protein MepA n=1 Tax=Lacticaseibacillus sharpeae JCM 1186 = DSM 20505 TaxID=1291052 RepID=A0A0R1ZZD5_9LACO|nr:MATE family efflux transporter [Lacticaseibacillus sharpeae]KRM56499.1 Na+-driven multidrug efflux pump [Lacticaseibacillus sharpeae JCM 1186 = DSM 20505]